LVLVCVIDLMLLLVIQKREKEFDEYRQEKVVQAKLDYRELLKETKIITYKCVSSFFEGFLI